MRKAKRQRPTVARVNELEARVIQLNDRVSKLTIQRGNLESMVRRLSREKLELEIEKATHA